MKWYLWVLGALLSLTLAQAAFAYRFEFITTVDGERFSGSEICLYKGIDLAGPASTYLASGNVHCFPADQLVDVPRGVWAFFASHPDGWISAHGAALRRETASPDLGYRAIEVPLERAAFIQSGPDTQETDRFVVYVPNHETRHHSPAVFPWTLRDGRILVPAGRPFTVLRIRDGSPVAAGPMTRLGVAEIAEGLTLIPPRSQRDFLVWIRIDESSLNELENVDPPVVRMVGPNGVETAPLYDFQGAGTAHKSLLIFRGAPQQGAVLRLAGKHWKTFSRSFGPEDSGEGFMKRPLVARLRQRIEVHWSKEDLPTHSGKCDGSEQARLWSLAVFRCGTSRGQGSSTCAPSRNVTITPANELQTFDLLDAGTYEVAVITDSTEVWRESVHVAPNNDVSVRVRTDPRILRGRITQDGSPVLAEIHFATGTARTDSLGRYMAFLASDPGANIVEILPCDGSTPFSHIPAEPIAVPGLYDIAIPSNQAEVLVVTESGQKLTQAVVGYGLFDSKDEAERVTFDRGDAVDGDGRKIITRLQPGYFLRICASAAGFATSCSSPVQVEGDTRIKRTLRLREALMARGRLQVSSPVRAGRLYLSSGDGTVIKDVPIEPDGSFSIPADARAQFCVITSANHPLIVITAPEFDTASETDIHVPTAPSRTFDVTIAESAPVRSGFFTLRIGGAQVPLTAFAAHQTLRGQSTFINGNLIRVPDVLETATIDVLVALDDVAGSLEDRFLSAAFKPLLAVGRLSSLDQIVVESPH